MSARSLTLQVGSGRLRMILLVLVASFIFLGGCIPTEGTLSGDAVEDGRLPIAQLQQIAREYYETENESVLDPITVWSDAELVIDLVAELEGGYEDWENQEEDGARWSSGLPDCGYLYGQEMFSTWANYLGNYSYLWSPNCYIRDYWGHCGPDGDNLVSFWMGPDWTPNQVDYNVASTGAATNAWLYLKQVWHRRHGGSNSRIHTNRQFGNAYFCLPARFNPERLRFGR